MTSKLKVQQISYLFRSIHDRFKSIQIVSFERAVIWYLSTGSVLLQYITSYNVKRKNDQPGRNEYYTNLFITTHEAEKQS